MKPVSGLETELFLFGRSVLLGAVMFVVYDLLRVLRRIFPRGIFWVSIEDLLYWVAAALYFFLQLCRENNGIIRGYILLGIILGALCYDRMISRFLMEWMTKSVISAKKRLKKLYKKVTMKLKIKRIPWGTEKKKDWKKKEKK